MFRKRQRHEVPELNATSMADISFMLLCFFLVTTSMNVDKGVVRQLAPPDDSDTVMATEVSKNRLLEIEITPDDSYLIDGKSLNLAAIGTQMTRFVKENGDRHVIAITSSPAASYNAYFLLQNEINSSYRRLRNDMAQKRYGKPFAKCTSQQREELRSLCQLHISEPQKTTAATQKTTEE